jgi:DNA-binding FadR family transcriptional regulator
MHQALQRSMMASLQHSRITPTALFSPENRKIVSAIGTRLKSFRTAMSNHISKGGNLLELHERQQRGEDTDANGNQID